MTAKPPLIVSISGIRGIVDQSLTCDLMRRFAAAFATWLEPAARVVLARDTRPSGVRFAQEVAAELVTAGCQVLDVGVCSTPGAKLMVTEFGAQGAVIITASHNPNPWNGMKLIRGDGIFLNAEQGQQVVQLFEGTRVRRAPGGRVKVVPEAEVAQRHLDRILAHVDVDAIRAAGLAAAVDPCNGAGALLIPQLLAALGVRPTIVHGEPHGNFAHEPEPLPANLVDLGKAVVDSRSDVGFAIDPDADRVALVDAGGRPVGEDYTLALAVAAVGARRPGPVVTTLSTSQTVTDAARRHNCPVVLTPVGEVHVVETMLAERAVVGGEGNGGVILTEIDPGRDAAVGVAVILEMLATTGRPLADLVAALPAYCIEKRKVTATARQLEDTVAEMQRRYPQAWRHPVRDGAKLYLAEALRCPWIHLRASNTEPVVRIIAESETRTEARALCDEAAALLGRT